jgi:hypothetical protein
MKPKAYAFIDSQNLNLGVRSMGWQIDYKKFRLYLKNKYSVEQAFMFIGMVSGNQKLYTQLQAAGFILIFKPTVRYFENGKETLKVTLMQNWFYMLPLLSIGITTKPLLLAVMVILHA